MTRIVLTVVALLAFLAIGFTTGYMYREANHPRGQSDATNCTLVNPCWNK